MHVPGTLPVWAGSLLTVLTAWVVRIGTITICEHSDVNSDCSRMEPNIYSRDSQGVTHGLPPCSQPTDLGKFTVDLRPLPFKTIEERHPEVMLGGKWRPLHCEAQQTTAIIIPYREREQDLQRFVLNLHTFMQLQLLDYRIFLIEQLDDKHFNRGSLLNVGFLESRKFGHFDCIIMHDVDKYPENAQNFYSCSEEPTLLMSKKRFEKDSVHKSLAYATYFSGVTAIKSEQFEAMNGFANAFWGWGSEDDDFYERMKHHSMEPMKVEEDLGIFLEIWYPFGFVNPKRHEVKKAGKHRYEIDGLNSINYKVVAATDEPLYTNISVTFLDDDPYYGL